MRKIKTLFKENKRVGLALIAIIVLVVAVSAAVFYKTASRSDGSTRTAQINITANGFESENLIIKRGTKVVWTNNDNNIHQVAANPYPTHEDLPGLVSEILNEGQSYEYTFGEAGVFNYHDAINPTTNGSIEVVD